MPRSVEQLGPSQQPPVRAEWYAAYTDGDRSIPQTTLGFNSRLGRSVLGTIGEGTATWQDFIHSRLTPPQIENEVEGVIAAHRQFGINVIPEGHTQAGERPFPTSSFQVVYDGGIRNVSKAIYELSIGVAEPHQTHPTLSLADEVEAYLSDPEKLHVAHELFGAAAGALESPAGRSAAAAHKARLNYRRMGRPSERITPYQQALVTADTLPLISQAVHEVGADLGVKPVRLRTFVKNVSQLDGINAA